MMKIISVNVGLPREVEWKGKVVATGIFKAPVHHRVKVKRLNLAGDRQADLTVHGGEDKAVYAYPTEHYAFWRKDLPEIEWQWGMFGENLTIEGLSEESLFVGDKLRIGSAEMMVTQPRLPCFKLGVRFGRADIVRRFLHSRRTGFYLKVLREGEVAAGDTIEWISRAPNQISVYDIVRLYAFEKDDRETLHRVQQVDALPEDWRRYFKEQLAKSQVFGDGMKAA